jgi:hypothetical protein
MLDDAQLKDALTTMLQSIDVPPRMIGPAMQSPARRRTHFSAVAAAAAAVALIATPLLSPAVMQSLEARTRAALQALGGIAPPAPPQRVLSKLKGEAVTLAAAQKRVSFTLVPPAGLPRDIISAGIHIVPTGTYVPATNSWKIGPEEVQFDYHRQDGRRFTITADPYNPNAEKPPKYIFDADSAPGGRPRLIKYENFAWRNGDQMMMATADGDLSAAEIRNIEAAMHAAPVAQRALHEPFRGKTMRLRVLVKP